MNPRAEPARVQPELPKGDVHMDPFGEIAFTDGRQFYYGDLYTPDAVRAILARFGTRPAAEPVTETYVQPVPDHCDRITWRNRYYSLPIAAEPSQSSSAGEAEAIEDLKRAYALLFAENAKLRAASGEPTDLIEAVDSILETAPCDCSDKRRYEQGEHLSGCYLFDLNIARGRMLAAAGRPRPFAEVVQHNQGRYFTCLAAPGVDQPAIGSKVYLAAPAAPAEATASLRHLYENMLNGAVRDTASAKRIATGLLGPAIEKLERAAPTSGQQAEPTTYAEPAADSWTQAERVFWVVFESVAKKHPGLRNVLLGDLVALIEAALAGQQSERPAPASDIPVETSIAWQAGAFNPLHPKNAVMVEGRSWYRDDHPQVARPAPAGQADEIHLAWRGALKACGVSEADRDSISQVVQGMLASQAERPAEGGK